MLSLCAVFAAHAGSPWPSEDAWQPLGSPLVSEPSDDASAGAVELAGAVLWTVDEATVFLRLALSDDPTGVDQDFGVLVDTDGDATTYEWVVLVQGPGHTLVAREHPNPLPGPAIGAWGPPLVLGDPATGETRPAPATLDLQLDRSWLDTTVGVDGATALHVTPVAAVAWPLGFTDVGGCDDRIGCTDLGAIAAGPVRIDGDGDGIPEPVEIGLGTDPDDADTDGDGLGDGEEADDTNGDGIVDALQADRDGDGLGDGLELGRAADADPSTTTDPNRADTDGGGLPDGVEDADGDGARSPFEPDPEDPDDDVDTDGDGIVDAVDDLSGLGPDDDSDGDGISDSIEGPFDTDGDGTPDFADLDADGDGLPDARDGDADPDGDGRASFRDVDADGDGLPDGVEGDDDVDEDGVPNHLDTDADGDGFADGFEGAGDTDNDGRGDFADPDADNDGIPDQVDRYGDRDGDGVRNARDLDSDGDGIPDAVEYDRFVPDFDGDGRPDFLDLDTDGDGLTDQVEGTVDEDCDGRPDFRDPDPEDGDCGPAPLDPPESVDAPGLPPREADPNPLALPGSFGGGACATGPRSPLVALLVVVGLLGIRGRASAQALDAQRLGPSADGGRLLVVEEARGPRGSGAAWVGSVTRAPFVYRVDGGVVDDLALVDRVVTSDAIAWLGGSWGHLGLRLPVHGWVRGYELARVTQVGDLEASGKASLPLSDRLDVGVLATLRLPTGGRGSFLSAERVVLAVSGLASRTTDRTLVAVELGLRGRAGDDLPGLSLGPAAAWGVGGAAAAGDRLWIGAELDGELALASLDAPGGAPVTAHLGARTRYEVANVRVALGRGLTSGLGAPAWRVVAGLEMTP